MVKPCLRDAVDRICAGEDPATVAADYPDLTINVSFRSTCEHDYSSHGVTSDDGCTWSAVCSKCGAAAIADHNLWDDMP